MTLLSMLKKYVVVNLRKRGWLVFRPEHCLQGSPEEAAIAGLLCGNGWLVYHPKYSYQEGVNEVNQALVDSFFIGLNEILSTYEGQTVLLAKCEPAITKLVTRMALSGEGTDSCLEAGSIPMPVHFYSPVPDIRTLQQQNIFSQQTSMPGIDMRDAEQLELVNCLINQYGDECVWPKDPIDNSFIFFTNNNSFSFGCAAILHCMIRHFKPRRIIEIGSGNSSRVIYSALQKNKQEDYSAEYTIVDPYPSEMIRKMESSGNLALYSSCVELIPHSFFDVLESGDVLFIDSSHVTKIGSDVNYLYLEILPRLKPGVIVHIHDICLPREYPEVYYTTPTFRMFWTEAYILQAFFACNNEFEVLRA